MAAKIEKLEGYQVNRAEVCHHWGRERAQQCADDRARASGKRFCVRRCAGCQTEGK